MPQAPRPTAPSPGWGDALRSGPAAGTKLTEQYVQLVAKDAYFWAWPMVNMINRRSSFAQVTRPFMAGPVPRAPLNNLAMLTDYIAPEERLVACPNQDVVYGAAFLALDQSAVVLQVPDFGDRFWVYQVVDTRTDGFAQLGAMHGTKPGFYLLVGPAWDGDVPAGITEVFRSSTNTGNVIPRAFLNDTDADRAAIQVVLQQIAAYPVADFDGTMKRTDWHALPVVAIPDSGEQETQAVPPETFFDVLPYALADAPPLPGEEARYAQVAAVLDAAAADPALRAAMDVAAAESYEQLVRPLFEFRNYGLQLPHHWSTVDNSAAFGTDYFTRTAVAKSNIFVNQPKETKYFYQDLDVDGVRLNGAASYTVTFPPNGTPPVDGFWSLTLYNEHHFFAPNEIGRYSLGTKNTHLRRDADGGLTIHVQADPPDDELHDNWLPSPAGAAFTLYIRAYWPKVAVRDGSWTPPPVVRVE
jgi:hypothetical protein